MERQGLRDYLKARGIVIGPKAWPGSATRQPGGFGLVYDPFQAAPKYEPAGGGVLYFDCVERKAFGRLLDLVDAARGFTDGYAVFVSTLHGPKRQYARRYLAQLRAISIEALEGHFGLRGLRDELGRPRQLVKQAIGLTDLMWDFILHQQDYWGTSCFDERAPRGAVGGDEREAREQLAFGLMSESHGICRIWSRAWLVER